jgi:tetratricopeptide (TPR) repeat protein
MKLISLVRFSKTYIVFLIAIATTIGYNLPLHAQAHQLSSQFAQKNSANDWYRQGVLKQQEGDYRGAVEAYDRAIGIDPSLVEAYNDCGLVHLELQEYVEAIADFDRAIELNPKRYEFYNSRGIARLALADYTGATEDFNQSQKINPYFAEAYLNLAELYQYQGLSRLLAGDTLAAIELFDRTIETIKSMPSNERSRRRGNRQGAGYYLAVAYFNRGLLLCRSGDRERAIDDLQKAAELFLAQDDRANYQLAIDKITLLQSPIKKAKADNLSLCESTKL